jgi:hypothetical protein
VYEVSRRPLLYCAVCAVSRFHADRLLTITRAHTQAPCDAHRRCFTTRSLRGVPQSAVSRFLLGDTSVEAQ